MPHANDVHTNQQPEPTELTVLASQPGQHDAPAPTPNIPDFTHFLKQKLQATNVDNLLIDRHEIILGARLGAGSYGEVYKAKWRGAEVAYKRILHQALTMQGLEEFCREVSVLASLRHPNIVLFCGVVVDKLEMGIVTQLVRQGSLYRILHKTRVELSDQRRLALALDTARGMHYLHTFKPPVVHRDLKSDNLLVDRDFSIKLCDFGLAQLKHSAFLATMSDRGTPAWAAPEVLRGDARDEKSDIYSFGMVLYELATGQVPWDGMHTGQVFNSVVYENERPELPDDMDRRTACLIRRCWAEAPADRPSFHVILEELATMDKLGSSASALALNTAQASMKPGVPASSIVGTPIQVTPAVLPCPPNTSTWHLVAFCMLAITAAWNVLVMWAAVWQKMLSWQLAVTLFAIFAAVVMVAAPLFILMERLLARNRGVAAGSPVEAVVAGHPWNPPQLTLWQRLQLHLTNAARRMRPSSFVHPMRASGEVSMVPIMNKVQLDGDKAPGAYASPGKQEGMVKGSEAPQMPALGVAAMPSPFASPFACAASPFACAASPFACAPSPFSHAQPSCMPVCPFPPTTCNPVHVFNAAVATLNPPCLENNQCTPAPRSGQPGAAPGPAAAAASQAPTSVEVSRVDSLVCIVIGSGAGEELGSRRSQPSGSCNV